MPSLAHIWRHPIKAIGAEKLDSIALEAGQPLPLDRAWAVLEDGGDNAPGWRSCRNFIRAAKGPSLMAISARVEGETLHLSHPDRPDLAMQLNADAETDLLDWVKPIYPSNRQAPAAFVKAPPEGMADAPFASVSVLNLTSLKALSQKAGRTLDMRRFRGNLWIEGLAPWEEFELIGRTLKIGEACLDVVEPIERCRATEANPENGQRDVDTLKVLESGWGHTEFGVYAKVSCGGTITCGTPITIQ